MTRDEALRALESDDWQLRVAAAAALDHAPQDDVVEQALVTATADRDARVRRAALHALVCVPCKPDACVSADAVDLLVDAMLHDDSVRLRRKMAGELMWGQHGRTPVITHAFREVLATSDDRVLRERAAAYLAATELPRSSMPYREWIGAWRRRVDELAHVG